MQRVPSRCDDDDDDDDNDDDDDDEDDEDDDEGDNDDDDNIYYFLRTNSCKPSNHSNVIKCFEKFSMSLIKLLGIIAHLTLVALKNFCRNSCFM